jgi:hypothetical protein
MKRTGGISKSRKENQTITPGCEQISIPPRQELMLRLSATWCMPPKSGFNTLCSIRKVQDVGTRSTGRWANLGCSCENNDNISTIPQLKGDFCSRLHFLGGHSDVSAQFREDCQHEDAQTDHSDGFSARDLRSWQRSPAVCVAWWSVSGWKQCAGQVEKTGGKTRAVESHCPSCNGRDRSHDCREGCWIECSCIWLCWHKGRVRRGRCGIATY